MHLTEQAGADSKTDGVAGPSVYVTAALTISTSLSAIGCFLVLFSFLRWRRLRRHPASLIVFRSIADFAFCIEMLASHLNYRANTAPPDSADCQAFSFFSQFCAMAAEMYFLMLSVDLLVSISNPFTNYRWNLIRYHSVSIGLSAVMASLLLVVTSHGKPIYGRDNSLAICWIRRYDGADPDLYLLYLFVIPIVIIYSFAMISLLVAGQRLAQGLPDTFEARLSIFRSSLRFVLSYVLYWATAALSYWLVYLTDAKAPPDYLSLVLAFALGGRGIVTALVWIFTYGQDLSCSCTMLGGRRGARTRALTKGPGSGVSDWCCLQLSLRPANGQGQKKASGADAAQGENEDSSAAAGDQLGEQGRDEQGRRPSVAAAAKSLLGLDDADVADLRPHLNLALRREIIYYTTLGIAKSALRAEREPDTTDGIRPKGRVAYNKLTLSRRHEEKGLFALEKQKEMQRNSSISGLVSFAFTNNNGSSGNLAGASGDKSRKSSLALSSGNNSAVNLAGLLGRFTGGAKGTTTSSSGGNGLANNLAQPLLKSSGREPAGSDDCSVSADMLTDDLTDGGTGSTAAGPGKNRGAGSGARRTSMSAGANGSGIAGAARHGSPSLRGLAGHTVLSINSPVQTQREPEGAKRAPYGLLPTVLTRGSRQSTATGNGGEGSPTGVSLPPRPRDVSPLHRGGQHSPSSGQGASSQDRQGAGAAGAARNASWAPNLQNARVQAQGTAEERGSWSYKGAGFQFVDYEPHLFRRLRLLQGISNDDYVRVLSRARREKFSEGASGAFLYFSTDERFIVKTLTQSECEVLLAMLPDYVAYLERHPHSMITQFYGCHAIYMYGRPMHFAVMNNVLISHGLSIHERYDLKGSWVNRHQQPLERGNWTDCRYCGQKFKVGARRTKNQCPSRPNHQHEANQVLRDADWAYKLRLHPSEAKALADQIVRDTEFLRRHRIMDYSLLLGIHRNKYRLVEPEATPVSTEAGAAAGGAFGSPGGGVMVGGRPIAQGQGMGATPAGAGTGHVDVTHTRTGQRLTLTRVHSSVDTSQQAHGQGQEAEGNRSGQGSAGVIGGVGARGVARQPSSLSREVKIGQGNNTAGARGGLSIRLNPSQSAQLPHGRGFVPAHGPDLSLSSSVTQGGVMAVNTPRVEPHQTPMGGHGAGGQPQSDGHGAGPGAGGGDPMMQTFVPWGIGWSPAELLSPRPETDSQGNTPTPPAQGNSSHYAPQPVEGASVGLTVDSGSVESSPDTHMSYTTGTAAGLAIGFEFVTPRPHAQGTGVMVAAAGEETPVVDVTADAGQEQRTSGGRSLSSCSLSNAAAGSAPTILATLQGYQQGRAQVRVGLGPALTPAGGSFPAGSASTSASSLPRGPGIASSYTPSLQGHSALSSHTHLESPMLNSSAVSTTFADADEEGVLYREEEGDGPVSTGTPTPRAGPAVASAAGVSAGAGAGAGMGLGSSLGSNGLQQGGASMVGSSSRAGGASGSAAQPSAGPGHSIQLRVAPTDDNGAIRAPVTPFFQAHRGGLRAVIVEAPGLYYMGIIDILQTYTWGKWWEHFFKTRLLFQHPRGISAIAPDEYAARFRSRVIAQLIDGYDDLHSDGDDTEDLR